jgi:hypothetical protein
MRIQTQMIVPGVSGTYKRELTRYFKKRFGTFANADFKRDLDLEPYQYNGSRIDFTIKFLSLF